MHSSVAFSSSPGDFMADGLDQLTLCSQSLGFGTLAAPVQVLFKDTESGYIRSRFCPAGTGDLAGFSAALTTWRFPCAAGAGSKRHPCQVSRLCCCSPASSLPKGGDFTADGLDQMTLCSQSPGFGTPAAPVQIILHPSVVFDTVED
ncbi:hypothetical protein STEG23_012556 [Scotinomys teguina]